MTAGLNARIRVWRMSEMTDDSVGGAMLTGTIAYESLEARLQPLKPDPLFLFQGIETNKIIRCTTRPATISIYENDEIEVTWPPQQAEFGVRYKVMKIQRDGLHPLDRRNFLELQLSRIKVARNYA